MAVQLRFVVDEILDPARPATGRAAEQLGRALLATAPDGVELVGMVSSSPEGDYRELESRLAGLARLEKSVLARREMTAAWRTGVGRVPAGMVHSPSLLAPLGKHDRVHAPGTQTVVTMQDALALTDPGTVVSRPLRWQKAMIKRAERFADALVVPSHAVADVIARHAHFGDRVQVIPQAPAEGLAAPSDAATRRERLGLPEQYVLTFASLNPRHQLTALITALHGVDAPLVIVGDPDRGENRLERVLADAGPDAPHVITLDTLDPTDLAAVHAGAAVFVQPSREEGFGLSLLESFALGTPVVASDAPAFVEVTAGAAEIVASDEVADGLHDAILRVLTDTTHADRLRIAGHDRVQAFSWRDSAEQVWQLHASL